MYKTNWNLHAAAIGDQPEPRRQPISPKTKALMVRKLESRGKRASIHTPDRTLIAYMKDSRR